MGLEAEPKPAMHQMTSLNRLSLTATPHCFIGCSIGEAPGLVTATALGWGVGRGVARGDLQASGSGSA